MGKTVIKEISGVEFKFHALNIREIRAVTKIVGGQGKELDAAFEIMAILYTRAEVVTADTIKPDFDDLEIPLGEMTRLVQEMMILSDLSDPNAQPPAKVAAPGAEIKSPTIQ